MDKKKVLFITPSLCQGGIERSQIIMLQMLDKCKYDLTLFLYGTDMTLLPLVPKEVCVVIDKEKPHYFRQPKAILLNAIGKLTKLIGFRKQQQKYQEKLRVYIHEQKVEHPAKDLFKGEEFDVVVSNAIGICTEMALHFRSKKYIVWYRASVDMHHEMLTRVLPQYNQIMAVSEGVKQMLSDNYPMIRYKITIINDFVSCKEVLEKAGQPCDISVPSDRIVIAACGRFTGEKGFDLAIEAASILKNKGVEFIWYFIGDGTDRAKLEEQIAELGLNNEIVITGFVANPFPIMKQCDIYVQPSYEESFGRTIKEALILGKPVVSTNTAGAREILGDNEYGLITSIDAKGLADGIIAVRKKRLKIYTIEDNQKEKEEFMNTLEFYLS